MLFLSVFSNVKTTQMRALSPHHRVEINPPQNRAEAHHNYLSLEKHLVLLWHFVAAGDYFVMICPSTSIIT